jgi:hypothetical protein
MDRVTQSWGRGVEGPRRRFVYPCCSELFNHRARTVNPDIEDLAHLGMEDDYSALKMYP